MSIGETETIEMGEDQEPWEPVDLEDPEVAAELALMHQQWLAAEERRKAALPVRQKRRHWKDRSHDTSFKLDGPAVAQKLLESALQEVFDYEVRNKTRQRRRTVAQLKKFKRVATAVLLDALHLSQHCAAENARIRISIADDPFANDAVKLWKATGFIDCELGYNVGSGRDEARMTTYWATDKLKTYGFLPAWVVNNRPRKAQLVVLRASKDEGEDVGETVPYRPNVQTRQWAADLERINEALVRDIKVNQEWLDGVRLNRTQLESAVEAAPSGEARERLERELDSVERILEVDYSGVRLRRIWNNSSWAEGGRMYGGWWQVLTKGPNKVHRHNSMLIGGKRTAELDYKGMFVKLLYAREGLQLAVDPYRIPGLVEDKTDRDHVKKLLNAMLNHTSVNGRERMVRVPADLRDWMDLKGLKDGQLIQAVLDFHPKVAHRFFQGYGLQLAFDESQIMVANVLKLLDMGITAAPIHDALLMPSTPEVFTAKELMEATYKQHTGFTCEVDLQHG